jgi:2-dehydro-3-deoxygluconokinase
MTDLVVVGELLATIASRLPGRLRLGATLSLSMAGAEANVAIAAARLGTSTAWIGRLADDELGHMMATALRGEGVDIGGIVWDGGTNTSLLVKHTRTADTTEVRYYRATGPGSRLTPEDLDLDAIGAARLLHVSGITPALGARPAATIERVIEIAHDANVPVSFDVNYRRSLWSANAARPVLQRIARRACLVFADSDELELIAGDRAPDYLLVEGVREVVLKDGPRGATVWTDGRSLQRAAMPVTVVDPVGAGDAFVGGYLNAHLRSASLEDKLDCGIRVGAMAVSTIGDWEGLPSPDELADFQPDHDIRR